MSLLSKCSVYWQERVRGRQTHHCGTIWQLWMVRSAFLRAELSALGTEPSWSGAGRPRPKDPRKLLVNCLVASRILFWSLELRGSYEHWMLINRRRPHFTTNPFGPHCVPDMELDPRGNWKLNGMKPLSSSCSQFDTGSIRVHLAPFWHSKGLHWGGFISCVQLFCFRR